MQLSRQYPWMPSIHYNCHRSLSLLPSSSDRSCLSFSFLNLETFSFLAVFFPCGTHGLCTYGHFRNNKSVVSPTVNTVHCFCNLTSCPFFWRWRSQLDANVLNRSASMMFCSALAAGILYSRWEALIPRKFRRWRPLLLHFPIPFLLMTPFLVWWSVPALTLISPRMINLFEQVLLWWRKLDHHKKCSLFRRYWSLLVSRRWWWWHNVCRK